MTVRQKKAVLTLLFFYLLCAPVAELLRGDHEGATILAGVGIAAILLTRLSDLSEFSGWGIAAKLEGKIKEADELINQLRAISIALAKASLQEIAMSGQMLSRLHTSEKFKVRDEITNCLTAMGVPGGEILKAHEVWITVFGTLLLNRILFEVGKPSSWTIIQKEIIDLPRIPEYDLPAPDSLMAWALTKNTLEVNSLTQEYKSLLSTGGMVTPDVIPFTAALSFAWKELPSA